VKAPQFDRAIEVLDLHAKIIQVLRYLCKEARLVLDDIQVQSIERYVAHAYRIASLGELFDVNVAKSFPCGADPVRVRILIADF
jgi:hypothetical protein